YVALTAAALSDIDTLSLHVALPIFHEVQRVEELPFVSFADTAQRLVPAWLAAITHRTFRVTVKRRGVHEFTTSELERYLGHALRSEEHTSELQSRFDIVCRLLLEIK